MASHVVWKFKWPEGSKWYDVPVTPEAMLVHAAYQGDALCLWFEIPDRDEERVQRRFHIIATDQDFLASWVHWQTVQRQPYVWHIYEEVPRDDQD